MFNRRFLRVKVFQALYGFYQDENSNRSAHEKNLLKSLDKARDLYLFMLTFASEFRFFLTKELDIQASKHFPDRKDIDPVKALIGNKAIELLEQNETLTEAAKSVKSRWNGTSDLFRNILNEIKESNVVAEYLASKEHSLADDKKLLGSVYEILIGNSEIFNQYIEEQFLNWEDDQVLVTLALLKLIQSLKEDDMHDFGTASAVASSEDKEFMTTLFRATIDDDDDLRRMIADKTKNWEADRIAMVDMLLMKMALCEILRFSNIPVKVSINEYLELAKLYSTPSSHTFINGVLDKIQIDLRNSNKIEKTGRGLVE